MKHSISKIKCTQHRFDFNDGSMVTWTLMDINANQHGDFVVDIIFKDEKHTYQKVSKTLRGPASAVGSLHQLKLVRKDQASKLAESQPQMCCNTCPHLLIRAQGIHETYLAANCTFQQRERFILAEADPGVVIETPTWCPLQSKEKEFKFIMNSKPLDTNYTRDTYE